MGTVVSGVAMSMGYDVSLLTGHTEKWCQQIKVDDLHGKSFSGTFSQVSSKASDIIPYADIIILCLPGYLISETLNTIRPLLRNDAIVGSIVSSTGFFFEAHKLLPSHIGLFGFQRVPFISRIVKYGQSATLLGYKKELYVAIENCDKYKLRELLESIFITPVSLLDSYYEASLTNSNPLLHTSRLYAMWKDWDGEPFESQSRFYFDWNDYSSEILISMDNEFMQLLKLLGVRDGAIPSILNYYECSNYKELTAKIKSISAFQPILSPMIQVQGGWVPDYKSRYFTEDFPYGLRFIKELINKETIHAPVIDKVYEWGMSIAQYDL